MRERRSITSCRTGAASRLVGLWSRRRLPYRIVPYLAVRPGREGGREGGSFRTVAALWREC